MRIIKVISAFVGVMAIVVGLGIAGAGAFVLTAADDTGGRVTAGPVRITTDSAALVGDDIDVFLHGFWFDGLDRLGAKIDVTSRNGKQVFVGVAPAREIDGYLSGTRHALVEFQDHDVILRPTGGSERAKIPAEQAFWSAAADGSLVWEVEEGRWALAVLNADGSPGVDVDVTAAIRVPFVRTIGAGLLVAGLIGLAVGAGLTYLGVRSTPGRTSTSPAESREEVPAG